MTEFDGINCCFVNEDFLIMGDHNDIAEELGYNKTPKKFTKEEIDLYASKRIAALNEELKLT